MKRVVLFTMLMGAASAAPRLAIYRYGSSGPERMFAGYNYIWRPQVAWEFDATCDSVANTCTSADYTPTTADVFTTDPDIAPLGGLQNRYLQFTKPVYSAINIGTNGNPANTWNIQTAKAAHGVALYEVTLTGSGTQKFYLWTGYQPYPYLRYPVGWPTGTSFTYWNYNSIDADCLTTYSGSPAPVKDPAGYISYPPYSAHVTKCAEVLIPATAAPGVYRAGWEFCVDQSANGCIDLVYSITIEAPPVLTYSTPAPVAMPSIYDQDTLCLKDPVAGTTQPGTNCSFKHLASGGSEQHGASYWCTDRANPDNTLEAANYFISFSNTGGAAQSTGLGFYYDGVRVWYHTAKWFNDPTWENCGRAIAARYSQAGPGAANWPGERLGSDGTNNGQPSILGRYANNGTPMYWGSLHSAAQMNNSFPKGIEMGLSRFNGGKYSSTWAHDSWNTSMKNEIWSEIYYNGTNGLSQVSGAGYTLADPRSPAYNYDGYVSLYAAGDPLYTMSGQAPVLTALGWHYFKQADAIASMLLSFTQPGGESGANWGRVGCQTWMTMGPVIESAINYWERTREPRMAMAIKYFLDLVITQYDWTNHAMLYVNAPMGPYCNGTGGTDPATMWYADGDLNGTHCAGATGIGEYPELDGMAAYAFAWYWRYFGGDSYRQMADEMFTYSLNGDANQLAYRYKPKPYYQNAKYWYEYLRYRLLN